MMNFVKFILSKSIIYFFLVSFSVLASAASSSDPNASQKIRIDFITNPDWVEIVPVEKNPESIEMRLINGNGQMIPISVFTQDGPASPQLVSIFKNKVKGKLILFAIVKWRYYLPGVDTEGDFYQVHGYETQAQKDGNFVFLENKNISDFFGSGFDGKQEGDVVHFNFKNAFSIREALGKEKAFK